ncbi:MAG: dienelactone hydrolase family protein [Alphaproteobacteria bacterium]|nr:dienelactone hydrolase family protein [Alphaproteobacteria bacterium]
MPFSKRFSIPVFVLFAAWFLMVSSALAVDWVGLDVVGTKVRAIIAMPEGAGPHPAVIFNHGTGVRHHGFEGSKSMGQMDVGTFTDALAKQGYVALAPIRPFKSYMAYVERGGTVGSGSDWAEVVERGIDTVKTALAYLQARGDVRKDRIGVVGFSEGGNVTLWTVSETPGFAAVVLMSPASLRDSGRYWLKNAASRDRVQAIKAPVYLSLGEDDLRSIKKVLKRRLVPNLKETNEGFESRLDYPGDHFWFHHLSDEFWPDITGFLAKHLK